MTTSNYPATTFATSPFSTLAETAASKDGVTLVHPDLVHHYTSANEVQAAQAAGYEVVPVLCGDYANVRSLVDPQRYVAEHSAVAAPVNAPTSIQQKPAAPLVCYECYRAYHVQQAAAA